ncbi:HIT family protein [Coralloluteibacterium stylophorae]|uniref:HIT family protein n=1 Tax=Coralloluteibacterium stylophorae TaxID=1776034 RepID=A0A8J7VT99_9GAMM|nr:HIT family protein [Coralloluteibacterium stylophorae]
MAEAPACVFCAIVAGRAAASIVHRDALCTAFMTIEPLAIGHTLVVPNAHATDLAELPSASAGHLFQVAQRIVAAQRASTLRCEGANLLMCDGAAAGQTVFHVHLHVSPRHAGDGIVMPHAAGPAARAELDAAAAALRSALAT